MAYQPFNPNKYKKTFDNMYGSGSFDSGLSNAREIGRLKVQADLAKQNYTAQQKLIQKQAKQKATKKTYDDAISYWSDPANLKSLKDKGAYGAVEDIKNNPSAQAAIKAQGYNLKDYYDAMYNASSGGNFKSEREYKNLTSYLNKRAKSPDKTVRDTNYEQNYGITDYTPKPIADSQPTTDQKSSGLSALFKKKDTTATGLNLLADFLNVLTHKGKTDKKSVKDSALGALTQAMVNKAAENVSHTKNKEVNRDLVRLSPLGSAANEYQKSLTGKELSQYDQTNRSGIGKASDFVMDAGSYVLPGGLAAKGVKVAGLGVKAGAKGLPLFGQLVRQGALTGGALGGLDVATREALNGKNYSALDNLTHVGLMAGLGGALEPAAVGVGKGVENLLAKSIKGEVPAFNGKVSANTLDKLSPNQVKGLEALKNLKPKEQAQVNEALSRLAPLKREAPKPISDSPLMNLRETAATKEAVKPKVANPFEAISPSSGGKLKEIPTPVNHDVPFNPNDPLPDTRTQIVSKTDKSLVPLSKRVGNKVSQAYISNVDNIYRTKQFVNDAERKLGRKLSANEDPYTLSLNSRSGDVVADRILTKNMVDHQGNVIGPSLMDITKQIPKKQQKELADYMVNKHAITRMERGEKVFKDELQMNAEKSKAIVAKYERDHPEIVKVANEFKDFNNQLADTWLVKTGVIPKDTWEGYVKANPDYVSNERYFSDLEKPNVGNKSKNSIANQSNPIKKATGSQRPIINPIETSIERVDRYVKTAKRNEAMQAVVKILQQNPKELEGWAEIVPTEKNPGAFMDSLEGMLEKEGVDKVLEELNKGFEQKPDLTHGNIVTGIVDGKPVHVRVHDPQFLEALTNISPKGQEGVIKAVGKVTRMMKTLTTGVNPVFSLARNIWRDIPVAYKNSNSLPKIMGVNNPFVFSKDLVSAIVDTFGNREAHQAFKNIGGGHSSPIASDIKLLDKSRRKILGEKGVKSGFEKAIHAIEALSNHVETAPRLAEFKRIAKNGDYASKVKGLYEANDITVNFNRYGNNVKQLDAIIPYLNAAVQGLDKFARTYKDHPIRMTANSVMAVTIPTAIAQAWNYVHDWEGYKALPGYVRDSNYLFSLGDGKFFKIPKPREEGMLFGALPERLLLQFAEKDPYAYEGYATSLLDNFVPPTRLITAPLNDLRANKDFAGNPIVPGDLAGASPRYQYDQKTSEVSKKIGDVFNVSPKQLDYIAKSYTGVLGQLGIPATSKGATVGNTLQRQVVADSAFSNNAVNRFYTLKDKLDTASRDYTLTGVKTKNYDDDLRKKLNSISREMSKVRKEIKATEKDTSLSKTEINDKTRKLQQFINQLAQQGYKMGEGRK